MEGLQLGRSLGHTSIRKPRLFVSHKAVWLFKKRCVWVKNILFSLTSLILSSGLVGTAFMWLKVLHAADGTRQLRPRFSQFLSHQFAINFCPMIPSTPDIVEHWRSLTKRLRICTMMHIYMKAHNVGIRNSNIPAYQSSWRDGARAIWIRLRPEPF